jgi:hypothetical protein
MMKLSISLDGNYFLAEDMATSDVVGLFRTWLNAQNLEPVVTLEQLTEQLRSNTDALNQAVVGLNQGEV